MPQPKKECNSIDYDSFLTDVAKRRTPSVLREITQLFSKQGPGTISLAVGMPNVNTFPFQEMEVRLKSGETLTLKGKEMEAALQYMPSKGYAPLSEKLKELVDKAHGPQDWECQSLLIGSGGQESMCNAIEMCLNEGDTVIIPQPVYPGTADIFSPHKPVVISPEQDKYGVRVDQLEQSLEKCRRENIPLPKIMYVNPTAGNPTGTSLTTERKVEIYRLACEYNFLILEDDPYFFLQFNGEVPTSFLSMDTEGRVIRFDSFSKILSSGLRLGFVTGPQHLLRKIELRFQISTLHTSALSQVLIHKLLVYWGDEKLAQHYKSVQLFYKEKRDCLIAACERHLKGLGEWNTPVGGMFLWLYLPDVEDTYHMSVHTCLENQLLVVPGIPFTRHNGQPKCKYIRLSFSLATSEQMEEGCRRLAKVIREEIEKAQRRHIQNGC